MIARTVVEIISIADLWLERCDHISRSCGDDVCMAFQREAYGLLRIEAEKAEGRYV